jgi:signal transduction histidine kinase/ligand-binding sensor domain-containing protein
LTLPLAEASADPFPPATPAWRLRTFTTRDGLAHNIVRDVIEQKDGTLWFATMDGLTRYAPSKCEYRHYRPLGPAARRQMMALAHGRDGAVWVATHGGGVGRLKDGVWRFFSRANGLSSMKFSALLVDRKGRIWAVPTGGGIARYDGSAWRVFGHRDGLSNAEIGRCTETRDGSILCGTYNQPLLQRFDGSRWSQLSVDINRQFYVHTLLEDKDGHLWLATKGAGVVEGIPDSGAGYRWRVHDRKAGLSSNRVGALEQARDGSLWAATSAGVSRYDGKLWARLSRADGLGSDHVFAIRQARDGALWFATLGRGVSRYGRSRWQTVTTAHGLPSNYLTGGVLVDRQQRIWVGTDSGLVRWSQKAAAGWRETALPFVANPHITVLRQTADGAVWVGTKRGLFKLEGNRWSAELPRALAGIAVTAFAHQRDALWLGTRKGLFKKDRSGGWRRFDAVEALNGPIYDLLVDQRNAVWVATPDGVTNANRSGTKDRQRDERLTNARAATTNPHSRTKRVYRLAEDAGGIVWASGLEGIDVRENGKWRRFPPSPWLPAGVYSRFVSTTKDGSVWFAVRGWGVRRKRGALFAAYTSRQGLAADTVQSVKRLPDGRWAFATLGGGLSIYRPDKQPPETFIGTGGPLAAAPPPSRLESPKLVFRFSGQDVLKDTETAKLRYSHRLDGGRWSPFSAQTTVVLRNVSAGNHTFEVRAMDQDLNIDPSPARYVFRVVVPWWRSPWVLALMTLAVLSVAFAGWRIARAVKREREAIEEQAHLVEQRRRFVRLASHELRKPLARMGHRAEMLSLPEFASQPDTITQHAEGIAADSRRLAQLVEQLLNQARIEEGIVLQLTRQPLRELISETIDNFERDVGVRPGVVAIDESAEIDGDALTLQLALRNLIDNAHKYGGGIDEVSVSTERQSSNILVHVTDNGPGISAREQPRLFEPFVRGKTSPEHAGFGLGLSFAREIARGHGGDITLRSPLEDDRGCRFTLSLPLRVDSNRTS